MKRIGNRARQVWRHLVQRDGPASGQPALLSDHDPTELVYYRGRSIMVTGAGGSVGSELCRQVLECAPATLVLVDRCELALSQTVNSLVAVAADRGVNLVTSLDCVTRADRMASLMRAHRVDVVFHAAAYKHVPIVETHAVAGIENNLFGTISVANAAVECGVRRFLLVSTDKAIAPTGMLGASKLLAEMALQDIALRHARPRISVVRFGNVYGSSGSVVPLIQQQIAQGGPISLTDSQATRYFMSVGEAARLLLCAAVLSSGGDMFALDMGRARSILALARSLMKQAGVRLPIVYTGLRPGERLHEPAPVTKEMTPTAHPRIFRSEPPALSGDMGLLLRGLRAATEANDATAIRRLVGQWVYAANPETERQSG